MRHTVPPNTLFNVNYLYARSGADSPPVLLWLLDQ